MNEIRLHNTLSNRLEPLHPLHQGEVRIYSCGPTVYDFAHIGNFRTFIFQDVLRRFLRSQGYRVLQVMNLTDVDDRIIANAAAAGVSIREYTEKYVEAFLEDMRALRLEMPEEIVRATDHIEDMVDLIERLQKKASPTTAKAPSTTASRNFRITANSRKLIVAGIKAGARVDNDRYEKDDARDFALWKSPKPGEHFWETNIGPGRPGWHIECSAMAMKYLGDTLDIHTGGIDLAFPHHENEIAQSEAATGHPFVKLWLHAEHLIIDGEKMSKSLGNFFTLRDLFAKGQKPSAIRYLLLSVPYRRQLNFTADSLTQAENSVDAPSQFLRAPENRTIQSRRDPRIGKRAAKAEADFDSGLADDLNTAFSLAVIFDLVRDVNTAMDKGEFRQQDAPARNRRRWKNSTPSSPSSTTTTPKCFSAWASAPAIRVWPAEEIEALIEERNAAKRSATSNAPTKSARNWPILVSSWKTRKTAVSAGNTNDNFRKTRPLAASFSPLFNVRTSTASIK